MYLVNYLFHEHDIEKHGFNSYRLVQGIRKGPNNSVSYDKTNGNDRFHKKLGDGHGKFVD